MQQLTLYCPARDQDVRVVVTDEPVHDAQATVMDSELICLEIGDKCTGHLCPICALPPEAVDARLARSGLRPDIRRTLPAHCDACDRDTELVLSSGGYITCAECGTTKRWSVAR